MKKNNKYSWWFLFAICLILVFLIILMFNLVYKELDKKSIDWSCSVWENGKSWVGEFNCYCPVEDSAVYANVKYPELCDWGYIKSKLGVSNYYNELGDNL